MKQLACFAIVLVWAFQSCVGSAGTAERKFYNAEFDWSITIPKHFDTVTPAQWARQQKKGEAAMEQSLDVEINNKSKLIFVLRSDQHNYFESNYQPFDTVRNGNYLEACKDFNNALYRTFATQIKDVRMDTAASVETIDGLDFQTFRIRMTYPNGRECHVQMSSRLFGQQEFSVNMMYIDEAKGEAMLNAWRNSRFGPKIRN